MKTKRMKNCEAKKENRKRGIEKRNERESGAEREKKFSLTEIWLKRQNVCSWSIQCCCGCGAVNATSTRTCPNVELKLKNRFVWKKNEKKYVRKKSERKDREYAKASRKFSLCMQILAISWPFCPILLSFSFFLPFIFSFPLFEFTTTRAYDFLRFIPAQTKESAKIRMQFSSLFQSHFGRAPEKRRSNNANMISICLTPSRLSIFRKATTTPRTFHLHKVNLMKTTDDNRSSVNRHQMWAFVFSAPAKKNRIPFPQR